MISSRPIAGRALGWREPPSHPLTRFWNPMMAPLSVEAGDALLVGALPEPLLAPLESAPASLFDPATAEEKGWIENGFALTADHGFRVAVRTEMPDVTPAMVDWWFGWHSDSAERYRLWHPQAHVHAQWAAAPPAGTTGRARYVGQTSIVDEYIGGRLIRAAIRFLSPSELGFTDPALEDPAPGESARATVICARAGLAEWPLEVGYLVHQVRRIDHGSEMRSRFWFGGRHAGGRSAAGAVLAGAGRATIRMTESDGRAMLSHCAQEMRHLGGFLPALYREHGGAAMG